MRQLLLSVAILGLAASSFGQAATAAKPKAPATAKAPAKAPAKKPAAPAGNPVAVFNTTAGTLRCTLFEKETPVTVENFIGLATGKKDWTNPASGATKHNTPLYDGTIFHRVIPEFMIQGGDPMGTGTGDPGYRFQDEFVDTLKFDRPGRLAMANSGPNTNGSQFFITEDSTHSLHLTGHHTIFGQCDDASVALVKKIARLPVGPGNKPLTAVRIVHLTIVRGGAVPVRHPVAHTAAGTTKKPTAGTATKKPKPTPQ
jgi:cyclophilin family peptidyl-prolyl cis-trans isomerase